MSRSVAPDRPYHHGQLRDALLTAAFELLQTQPAGQISLREIARQAGVSHAAPYHHFPDRTHLLSALAEKCNALFFEAQQRAVQAQTDPQQRLLALGEAYVRFAVQYPNAFSLIFDPEICPPGEKPSAIAGIIQASHDLLLRTVQDAQQGDHRIGHDPQLLSLSLWGTVHGLAQLVLLGHIPAEAVPGALRALMIPAEQP